MLANPRKRTPWGDAIDDILLDGQWHLREDLFSAGYPHVPPSMGYRNAQHRHELRRLREERKAKAEGRSCKRGPSFATVASTTAAGTRYILRDALWTSIRNGFYSRDGDKIKATQKLLDWAKDNRPERLEQAS